MGNEINLSLYPQKTQNVFSFGTKKTNYLDKINKELEDALKAKAEAEAKAKAEREAKAQFEQRSRAITSIIDEDINTPKNVDSKELSLAIMNTAKTVGVDPLLIACICKKESHFDQNQLGSKGKGIAQITSIVPADMYLRPKLFDEHLGKLIDEYGSLQNVFAAKKADPKLNIGDFGEMLYKNKTSNGLFEALKKDRDLNLKCCAYLLKFRLNESNGNVRKAVENYNNTPNKKSYANVVMKYMDNAKSMVRLNFYY